MPKSDRNNFDCHKDNDNTQIDGFIVINKAINSPTNSSGLKHIHSPKVFTADSTTVNTPAKDVLGPKYNNFTRNLKPANAMPAESAVLIEVNTPPNTGNGHLMNGNGAANGKQTLQSGKLQPVSACYDRYPKPGSYGSIQVYPMNGINLEINSTKENVYNELPTRHRPPIRSGSNGDRDDDISKMEHDRLEDILKMCADFERQNQNVQSSPIVQNRIKTNGSLPREKKSPMSPDRIGAANVFFSSSPYDLNHPSSSPHSPAKSRSGYENVQIVSGRKVELSSSPSSQQSYNGNNGDHKLANGYENVMTPRKSPATFVPQSPRTRIKTCISPKKELTSTPMQRKTDYDLLVQSFEEKLRWEIQQLRGTQNIERRLNQSDQQRKVEQLPQHMNQSLQSNNGQHSSLNRAAKPSEGIYGTLTTNKNKTALKVNIKRNLDENQIAQLKRQQVEVLRNARELRTQISEFQQQEEEVLREVC